MSNLCVQVNSIIGMNQLIEEKKILLNGYYNIFTDFKCFEKCYLNYQNFKDRSLTSFFIRIDNIYIDNEDEINNEIKCIILSKQNSWEYSSFNKRKLEHFIVLNRNSFDYYKDENICSNKIWITSF